MIATLSPFSQWKEMGREQFRFTVSTAASEIVAPVSSTGPPLH
jgi:hypothetical protein